MKRPFFTVCVPSYNCETIIGETLVSLIHQTFTDWECLVVDDGSSDHTEAVVTGFADPRIRFVRNDKNLGYPGNLQRCFDLSTGEVIYLLANDDVLSPVALEKTYAAFHLAPDIALVIRPYYWFERDPHTAIRYTKQFDPETDRIMAPTDGPDVWRMIFASIAQLSALAYRRDLLVGRVNPWVFPAHAEPWLATFKKHRAVFLRDYQVAVRKGASQTRKVSSIYDPSPLWSWVEMFDRLFWGSEWAVPRKVGRSFVARNVEGLVQIRCHSTLNIFLREAFLHAYYRPLNLIAPRYWFFFLGSLLLPRSALRKVTDLLTPLFYRPRSASVALSRSQ